VRNGLTERSAPRLAPTLLTPLDLVGANHLFRLVSAAYETRSLVVTSNWAFEQWTNFLPDVTAASAILDPADCEESRQSRQNHHPVSPSNPPQLRIEGQFALQRPDEQIAAPISRSAAYYQLGPE